jgi:hypothetical protein
MFEHQNNRQIKINAAVREPSLAEQHWMQRIVGQGRGGRGGGVVAIVNGISGRTPVDLSTCGGISFPQKKTKNKSVGTHCPFFMSKINRFFRISS